MKQYIMNVPNTEHTKKILNYIIQTGYFEGVELLDKQKKNFEEAFNNLIEGKTYGPLVDFEDKITVFSKMLLFLF